MGAEMIFVNLPMEPKGKGRPRVTFRGGYARAYTPATTAKWEKAAATILRNQWIWAPRLGPVKITIDAISKRPKRLQRRKDPEGLMWRAALPDADNVAKACLDAIQAAGIIENDKQVVDLRVRSLYSEKGEPGRVLIGIAEIEEVFSVLESADSAQSSS